MSWTEDDVRAAADAEEAEFRARNGHRKAKKIKLGTIRGDLASVRRTRWAWKGWAPLGCLVLVAGEGSAGKGVVTCYLLAQLTRGQVPGDLMGRPVNILWVGFEDSWEEQVLPRLAAAGGDVTRAHCLKVETVGESLDLARDAQALGGLVDEQEITVIAFEAIVDHLAVDDHKNQEVRRALAPTVELARSRGLLVLGTTHLNKATTGSYRHRVAGSGGYLNVARVGWLVHKHPESPERRVLAFAKGNIGEWPDSMVFEIEGCDVPNPVEDEVANVGRVAPNPEPYLDRSLDVDTVLAGPKHDHGSLEDDVTDFLTGLLEDGAVRATDVFAAAGKERPPISKSALRRHKDAAGVHVYKEADGWWWRIGGRP